MTLQTLLLDVGDTLVRERPSRFEIYAAAARARGVEIDARGMAERMRAAHEGLPRTLDGNFRYTDPWFEAFIRRIFGDDLGLSKAGVDALVPELFARFESPDTFEPYPGARELLAAARERGLTLGIVSNWSARLDRVLAAVGLEGAFDFVLCSALEGVEKPDPEIFRRALARAGGAPEATLHAGDHLRNDVEPAQGLGIRAVLVDHRGRFEGQDLPCPRVSGLDGLRAML